MTQITEPTDSVAARPPGRPRSERAEKAIVDATLDLLVEEGGVAGVSIEAVAARAGVGKTTIYRRWPNKEELIIAALAALKAPLPEPGDGPIRDDLIALASAFLVEKTDRKRVDCYWSITGSAEKHPDLLDRFTREIVEPRRDHMRAVLRHGIETGELRADMDIELTMWLLMGPIVQRARAHGVGPIPADFAEKAVDTLLRGIAA